MRQFLFVFISIFFIFATFPTIIFSQDAQRFATCDLCGYCQGKSAPSNWEQCRACLYPEANSSPEAGDTLKIDPETNNPPTPALGRWYTFLGCINTNLGSFEQEGAAGSVVQILLNIIFSFVGAASLISLLYGAFVILTSQNNPEKINLGKRIIFGAIAGLIFAIAAVFLVSFIGEKILKLPGFQSTSAP
jgi:hypothetical protein